MEIIPLLPINIKNTIAEIVKQASQFVQISKVYLYGSYANGTYNKESDIDLAFFITDNTKNLYDAHRTILKIVSKYHFDVQPQTFYFSEIKEKSGIVGEIVETGIEIEKIKFVEK